LLEEHGHGPSDVRSQTSASRRSFTEPTNNVKTRPVFEQDPQPAIVHDQPSFGHLASTVAPTNANSNFPPDGSLLPKIGGGIAPVPAGLGFDPYYRYSDNRPPAPREQDTFRPPPIEMNRSGGSEGLRLPSIGSLLGMGLYSSSRSSSEPTGVRENPRVESDRGPTSAPISGYYEIPGVTRGGSGNTFGNDIPPRNGGGEGVVGFVVDPPNAAFEVGGDTVMEEVSEAVREELVTAVSEKVSVDSRAIHEEVVLSTIPKDFVASTRKEDVVVATESTGADVVGTEAIVASRVAEFAVVSPEEVVVTSVGSFVVASAVLVESPVVSSILFEEVTSTMLAEPVLIEEREAVAIVVAAEGCDSAPDAMDEDVPPMARIVAVDEAVVQGMVANVVKELPQEDMMEIDDPVLPVVLPDNEGAIKPLLKIRLKMADVRGENSPEVVTPVERVQEIREEAVNSRAERESYEDGEVDE
jgi:hypothetical protein